MMRLPPISLAHSRGVQDAPSPAIATSTRNNLTGLHLWRLDHANCELVAPNQKVGMAQVGKIGLTSWLDIPEALAGVESVVGLSKDGEVYQIFSFTPGDDDHRYVARRLSGSQRYRDLSLSDSGRLLAVRDSGQVDLFSNDVWTASAVPGLLRRAAACWAGATAGGFALAYGMLGSLSDQAPGLMLVVGGFVGAAALLSSGLSFAMGYDRMNERRNGFVPTGQKVGNGQTLADCWEAVRGRLGPQADEPSRDWSIGRDALLPRMPEAATIKIEI